MNTGLSLEEYQFNVRSSVNEEERCLAGFRFNNTTCNTYIRETFINFYAILLIRVISEIFTMCPPYCSYGSPTRNCIQTDLSQFSLHNQTSVMMQILFMQSASAINSIDIAPTAFSLSQSANFGSAIIELTLIEQSARRLLQQTGSIGTNEKVKSKLPTKYFRRTILIYRRKFNNRFQCRSKFIIWGTSILI